MKINIRGILWMVIMLSTMISCERELDSEGITAGLIRYPDILIDGDNPIFVPVGSTYSDAGAMATLGTDDITEQMTVEDNVETSTPGVYTVDYSVSITNELDQQSTVVKKRIVAVTDGDVCDISLAGTYSADFVDPSVNVKFKKEQCGVFSVSDAFALSEPPPIPVKIYLIGNGELEVPVTSSAYGDIYGHGVITGGGLYMEYTFVGGPTYEITYTLK